MKNLLSMILLTAPFTACDQSVMERDENEQPMPPLSASVQQTEPVDRLQFIPVGLPQGHLSESEIRSYVDTLAKFRHKHGINLDAQDLAEKLSNKIATAINDGHAYDLNGLLDRDVHHDITSFTCYSFGYDCGGTRGYIYFPIITWIDPDMRLRAFNLSTYQNCRFTKIHELSRELLLLIGDARGSGACHNFIAYVMKLNENGIDAEYPAFVDRPYLNFCNTPFEYDTQTKMLYTVPHASKENIYAHLNDRSMYGQFSTDSPSRDELFDLISKEYFDKGSMHLKFENGKFR